MVSTQKYMSPFKKKKQNMYNCWGSYVLVRTVYDTLDVGILTTIKEADHYWH